MDNQNNAKLPAFEGIGQVEVDFLGQRVVIGCIEGEEEMALRLAKRFEADAGEVTKAVSGPLEPIQAMLMAAILAYEQIEQGESDAGSNDRT